MSTILHPLRYVARVTIEFTTPFLVGSGEADLYTDAAFVTDANGLPALPGTSITGVLRHYLEQSNSDLEASLFGHSQGDDPHGSRLSISWGVLHDSQNRPVEGLARAERLNDPVLNHARYAVQRDHVRIDHRGVAQNNGKFDENAVGAGHRFSFELHLEGNTDDQAAWQQLLAALSSGQLRLGGKTRRGFGAFRLLRLCQQTFDLSDSAEFATYQQHPVSLAAAHQLPIAAPPESDASGHVQCRLQLVPEGFWMIGGGNDDAADMNPVLERRISWQDDRGSLGPEEILIPGSSVKGALAHRIAYYANALDNNFADPNSESEQTEEYAQQPASVRELFGYCKGDQDAEEGQIGRISIDDNYLTLDGQAKKFINHVAIDRFTGGAIDGALFSEEPFYLGDGFELKLIIHEPTAIGATARQALQLALTDLAEGRLAFGSGTNRGNGYFGATAAAQWSDQGAWIGGAA